MGTVISDRWSKLSAPSKGGLVEVRASSRQKPEPPAGRGTKHERRIVPDYPSLCPSGNFFSCSVNPPLPPSSLVVQWLAVAAPLSCIACVCRALAGMGTCISADTGSTRADAQQYPPVAPIDRDWVSREDSIHIRSVGSCKLSWLSAFSRLGADRHARFAGNRAPPHVLQAAQGV